MSVGEVNASRGERGRRRLIKQRLGGCRYAGMFRLLAAALALLDSRRLPRCLAMRSGRRERPTSGQEGAHAAVLLRFPASHSRRTTGKGGDGVRRRSVWKKLLGLQRAVVGDVELTNAGGLVVSVRPAARERDRCPFCRRRCPGCDWGEGRRRWRALDFGTTFAYLEADAPRVSCKQHGVIVAAVPWARHDSGFTRSFEDQVAWLRLLRPVPSHQRAPRGAAGSCGVQDPAAGLSRQPGEAARCGGTRTPGSGGGPRKRSGRKAATAPRADPTSPPTRSTRSAARSGTKRGAEGKPSSPRS